MKKLYVLTRKDLSKSQQAVQAGHVVGKIASKNSDVNWDKQTFVYLTVKNEKALKELSLDISEREEFREPDIGNSLTAVATFGGDNEFAELPLM